MPISLLPIGAADTVLLCSFHDRSIQISLNNKQPLILLYLYFLAGYSPQVSQAYCFEINISYYASSGVSKDTDKWGCERAWIITSVLTPKLWFLTDSNTDVTQGSDLLICPGEPLCWTVITAIIRWANVISVTSDVLQIPTQHVMLFSAAFWIHYGHTEALCDIWQLSGALVTPHLIKRNWLWRTSCQPSSLSVCPSVWYKTTTLPGPSPWTHRRTGRGPAMAEILVLPVYCFKTQQGAEKQWAQPAFSFFLLTQNKYSTDRQAGMGSHTYTHSHTLINTSVPSPSL